MTPPADTTPADTTPADTTPAGDGTPEPGTPEGSDLKSDPESPNAEAAKYRRQLRDTEQQRDALAGQVAAMQRRECEAALGDLLDVPGDIWDIGQADPALFYAEDGSLNLAELRAAAGALIDQRPRLGKAHPRPQWGQTSGELPAAGISWSTVLGS
jgi:hypothetical protein